MFRHEAESLQARTMEALCKASGTEEQAMLVAQLKYINYVLPYTRECDFNEYEDKLIKICKLIMSLDYDMKFDPGMVETHERRIRTYRASQSTWAYSLYSHVHRDNARELNMLLEYFTPDNTMFSYTCYDKTTTMPYMPELMGIPAPQLIRGMPYSETVMAHYHEYQDSNSRMRAGGQTLIDETSQNIMKAAIPCPYYLYRISGISRDLVIGEEFTYKGIMSWTSDYNYALDFNKGDYKKGILVLRPGVEAACMNASTANFTNESEWVLPPGCLFEVVQELEPLADYKDELIPVWEIKVIDYTCEVDSTPMFPMYMT